MQKAIIQAEDPGCDRFDINVVLVGFYKARGIEFLGETTFGEEIFRPGARWKLPEQFPPSAEDAEKYEQVASGMSFMAARSLLRLTRKQVAEELRMSRNLIADVEYGVARKDVNPLLRSYYSAREVDFLGWGEVGLSTAYGVGVRWKAFEMERGSADVSREAKWLAGG